MDIRSIMQAFSDTHALVVGDVMLDAYLWGKVDRISPEAPVPIMRVTERSSRLGGAANVALNLRALGATTEVAAVCGDDDAADRLGSALKEHGIGTAALCRSSDRKTTVKSRVISGSQHIVRVDDESVGPLNKREEDLLLNKITALIADGNISVIVLEDYNKGVLTPKVIERTIHMARTAGIPIAVDPKRENFLAYKGVDLFKPNLRELAEGLKMDISPTQAGAVEEATAKLADLLKASRILVTLSQHGAYILEGDKGFRIKAHERTIADVSGAGDTVIATAALCLAAGLDARTMAMLSNLAGGIVCESVGVVPVDPERFAREAEALLA